MFKALEFQCCQQHHARLSWVSFPGTSNSVLSTDGLSSDCSSNSVPGVSPTPVVCAGTDHSGADWTLFDGDIITGVHCNVGTLSVPASITAYTAFESKVSIDANVVNIEGMISADGEGYGAQQGPGAASATTGGGGHASAGGGANGGAANDDPVTPAELGSGGGSGAGGGYVKIVAKTSINFIGYSGTISARGSDGATGGGGAGGTIVLKAPSIVAVSPGYANLYATGGPGVSGSGGGSGGRIFIEGTTTGTISKSMGGGYGDVCCSSAYNNGGPGTAYTVGYNGATSAGSLRFNGSYDSDAVVSLAGLPTFASLYLGSYVKLTLSTGTISQPIIVDGGEIYVTNGAAVSNLTITSGKAQIQDSATVSSIAMSDGNLKITGSATLPQLIASGGTIYPTSSNVTYGDIAISGSAKMTHEGFRVTPSQKLYINASNLTIGSGASIDVTGVGFSSTFGAGGAATGYKGGGRMALYYNTKTFSGSTTFVGGTGSTAGSSGTLYDAGISSFASAPP